MFPRPAIAALLARYVVVELHTDGTDAASERNQQRQQSLFQTVAIPYYAALDENEKPLATFPGLTRDTAEFAGFLTRGLQP
jgi:hypothetical protein